MNENPITNATGLSAVIPKDNDGYCTVYKLDCADGLGLMTVYQVYPGIQLIYNDFEATSCYWDGNIGKNVLEINHCREGREGSVLQSGSCLYLGEGDLSIHTMDNCASEMSFPLKHYRGISVVLDLELVSENPPGILTESGIDTADFKNKFCADGSCFVMRAKDDIEHIFSELYSVPDRFQKPYFMLKVQELLLFLCMVNVKQEKQRELYTSPQVEIVRQIHKRLISNLHERLTIEELSKEYHINTATLKDTFKGVYGQPMGKVAKIAANFSEYIANEPKVSYRDGRYFVFDGQNTIEARKTCNGGRDLPIRCKVFYGLSKEHEALLFAVQTGISSELTAGERLRAKLVAHEENACDFVSVTEDTGVRFALDGIRAPWKIYCIRSAYYIYKSYGAALYREMLSILVDAWDGDSDSFLSGILHGMARFLALYQGEYSRERLILRLRTVHPKTITRLAQNGTGNVADRHMKQILSIYNGAGRAHSLPCKR